MSNPQQLRFLSTGHFFHHYLLGILPIVALPIQAAWSLSSGEAIALGTPLYALLVLATLPSGWLGDVLPRQWLIAICLTGSGLAAVLAGLSVGPVSLSLALALLGAFSAIYHPVGLAMVADYADRSGPAYAINGMWGNLGTGIAAAISVLLSSSLGWRAAFVIPGIIVLGVGLLYAWVSRGLGDRRLPAGTRPNYEKTIAEPKSVVRILLLFLVAAAVYDGLVAGAITYTLPRFLEERAFAGDEFLLIGGSTSLILTLGSLTQLFSGWGVERYGARPLLAILFAGQIAALMALAMVSGPFIVPLMGLFYGLLYAWFPLTPWLIGRHVPARLRARILSVEYLATLGTIAAAIPFVAWLYSLGIALHEQLWMVILSAVLVLGTVAYLPGRNRGGRRAPVR